MNSQSCIPIKQEWDIVGARQLGREYARTIGFGAVDQARIATAISELARNIYLYTNDGEICIKLIKNPKQSGVKIISRDTGPGIENISVVMGDGFTTSGGLGAGLPGVKRLMDEFDIQSEVGRGTVIQTVKWVR